MIDVVSHIPNLEICSTSVRQLSDKARGSIKAKYNTNVISTSSAFSQK